jgi:hypothetical protein
MISDFTKMQINSYIQNVTKYITQKIYVTKDVRIIHSGKPQSVYWRYLILYTLSLFKISLLQRIFNWCSNLIDVSSDTLHIVQNINYVDRYIIYDNDERKNVIQNSMKYIEDNKEQMNEINLPKCLVLKCYLREGITETNLKDIFQKYATETFKNHDIENILKYNEIQYSDMSTIFTTIIKAGKIYNLQHNITKFLKRTIFDLYENIE